MKNQASSLASLRIMFVAMAETKIDSVVDNVRKYVERFIELPLNATAVLITHMDQIKWSRERFVECIDRELGIRDVVFSG